MCCIATRTGWRNASRSEEHTSELQSQSNLVCRLLLEKKNNTSRSSPDRLPVEASSGMRSYVVNGGGTQLRQTLSDCTQQTHIHGQQFAAETHCYNSA